MQPNAKREFVEELLKYKNKKDLYSALKSWVVPRFPINGNLLKEKGCPAEKKMGVIMNELKQIWISSDFKLSADDLLDKHLPLILENMTTSPSTPRKKIKTSK